MEVTDEMKKTFSYKELVETCEQLTKQEIIDVVYLSILGGWRK